jgi:hypothetical protein
MHAAAGRRAKGSFLSRCVIQVRLKLHVIRPKQVAQYKVILYRLEVSLCCKDRCVHIRRAKRHPFRKWLSAINGVDVDRNKRCEHRYLLSFCRWAQIVAVYPYNPMARRGNRAVAVREACKKRGGFHLGSIGGAAANLAAAFIIIDDKGNDFFKELNLG